MPSAQNGLSVMDAPLPASFDSQGISQYARYGPVAASVPSRFGLDPSPPISLLINKHGDSATLRNLHSSAFGDHPNGKSSLASSPPASGEEAIGRRIMHSERFSRPKPLSHSLGTRLPSNTNKEEEWDSNFAFEEDLVPTSLHDDILTPQEKSRRFSRNGDDDGRAALSGLASSMDGNTKAGSPAAASPSRFGALFSRQKSAEAYDGNASSLGSTNAFGHVGSPLRNSALHPAASPSLRPVSKPTPGDISPFISSPPRQSSMSMISQQLQRTRLSNCVASAEGQAQLKSEGGEKLQHPGMSRVGSVTSTPSNSDSPGRQSIDRAVSSSSVGRDMILEEGEDMEGMFDMDEVGDKRDNGVNGTPHTGSGAEKRRLSGPWAWGKRSSLNTEAKENMWSGGA